MPTYTNDRISSSHRELPGCPTRWMFLAIAVAVAASETAVCGENFAQPPEWSDEVKEVFFDDALKELKGEPPTTAKAVSPEKSKTVAERSEQAVWRELVTPAALESAVKSTTNRVAQSVRQSARFEAGLHKECRRDFTLLGTLFQVIGIYPGDVRWKSTAAQISQLCLQTADACSEGTDGSLQGAKETLAALEESLRGQTVEMDGSEGESIAPEFAPLMKFMEFVTEEELPAGLSKPTQFRRSAVSISEQAQMLAMLSHVIRGEEYGYADDETYQAHADKLRDAARSLNDAAKAEEFEKAVQASAAIQKACADCHADFRG